MKKQGSLSLLGHWVVCGATLTTLASAIFVLPGCKWMRKEEKSAAKQNFGSKLPGLASFKKMGLYRSGKQFCQNEPEFHIKKPDDHHPWSNIYGWVCTDPVKGLIEVRDGDDNIFATGLLKNPNMNNGSSNVEKELGTSYIIRDGQNIVVAHLNQDQNWTLENIVQKTFRITNRSTALIGTSTKLPFTFLYTSFAINSPSEKPLAKVWSHFWNWTVEDVQDEKNAELDRLTLRRVLYVIPMIYELKNRMDAKRTQMNPAHVQDSIANRHYYDLGGAPEGYDPYAAPAGFQNGGLYSPSEFGLPLEGAGYESIPPASGTFLK